MIANILNWFGAAWAQEPASVAAVFLIAIVLCYPVAAIAVCVWAICQDAVEEWQEYWLRRQHRQAYDAHRNGRA